VNDFLVTRTMNLGKESVPMPEGPALAELRHEIARLEAETPRRQKVPAFAPLPAAGATAAVAGTPLLSR
jgi:hypothetical protein